MDLSTVFHGHDFTIVGGYPIVEDNLYIYFFQKLQRFFGGLVGHALQQLIPTLDEDDFNFGAIHFGVILGQDVFAHFSQRTSYFDSGWSTPYNYDIDVALAFCFIGDRQGFFIIVQNAVAQVQGLGDRFHRQGFGRQSSIAKKVGIGARSNHQLIVVDNAKRSLQTFFVVLNGRYFGDPNEDVGTALKKFAQWERNRTGFQTRHGHLVKQGLKLVVVVFIDQNHLIIGFEEFFGQQQARKTTADDDDALEGAFRDIDFHINPIYASSNCNFARAL